MRTAERPGVGSLPLAGEIRAVGCTREAPVSGGGTPQRLGSDVFAPEFGPPWLQPLVDNVGEIPDAYRRRLPPDVLAMVTASKAAAGGGGRDAAVLVLFSGPQSSADAPDSLPDDADLLLIVRAATLRHHAGQAAFPGGASDPGDGGPVATALREARGDRNRYRQTASTGHDGANVHRAVGFSRRPGV